MITFGGITGAVAYYWFGGTKMRCEELAEFVALLVMNEMLTSPDDWEWCVDWMQTGIDQYGEKHIVYLRGLSLEHWALLIKLKPVWRVPEDTTPVPAVMELAAYSIGL